MAWYQLCFPWAPPRRCTICDLRLRGDLSYRDVDLRIEEIDACVRLSMRADSPIDFLDRTPEPETFVIALDVGPEPLCTITETSLPVCHSYPTGWTMTERPDPQAGPFGPAATWALSRLLGQSHDQDLWRTASSSSIAPGFATSA